MGGSGPRSFARLAADFAYLINAGLLATFTLPFIYARVSLAVLAVACAFTLTFAATLLFAAIRRASHRERIGLAALALVLAGISLMVVLGRPSEETVVVRWAAKHVGPAFVWLCLLIAAAWHTLWKDMVGVNRRRLGELTLVALAAYGAAQTALGHLGLAVAFPPFGYPAEIRDAIDRRAGITALRQKVISPIARAAGGGPITVPTLDGPFIAAHHAGLFDYNFCTYLPFFGEAARRVILVRNAAMHPWSAPGVATVPVLRDAVSPAFVALLARDEALRSYYLAPIPLRTRPVATPGSTAPLPGLESDGTITIRDAGTALVLHSDAFDPETAPKLTLAVERIGGGDVRLDVIFQSDFAADSGGPLVLAAGNSRAAEADLRQWYAFALSRRVSDLRLVFSEPGRYRVRAAALAP